MTVNETRGVEPALESLRRAAKQGDGSAKAVLAERLLTCPPYGLEEGTAWAVAAARDGNPTGAHLAALLSAWGLGLKQDWQSALDFTSIAAGAGSDRDVRVLAGLAGQWQLARDLRSGVALSADQCAELRRAVRIEALLACPPARVLSQAPRIEAV